MNKLLLLALLGAAFISFAGAKEKKVDLEVEDTEIRETRDAQTKMANRASKRRRAEKKNMKRKSGGKSRKEAKRKRNQKRNEKRNKKGMKAKKKSSKKLNSSKKGKKNSSMKSNSERKSRKEAKRKMKEKRKEKGMRAKIKSTKKSKKGRRKSRKKSAGGARHRAGPRSTCLNFTCVDEAVGYLKLLKDKVANFEKQNNRITKQNKTGSSKSGKQSLFGPAVRRIVENGGGNSSNLTCNGATNAGSAQLTNLTETLLSCEDEIKKSCDPSNLPQPNMTEVVICSAAITTFKNKTTDCLTKSGSAACSCWDDTEIASAATTIRTCDLSSNSKLFAKALKNCTQAFGKCRKYEDDVSKALHACNTDTSVVKRKLKNLKQNKAALESQKTKLDSAASRRFVRESSTRALSCASVISTSQTITTLVTQSPAAYSIYQLIQTILSSTFSCTESEKESLKTVSSSVSVAIVLVTAETTHLQEVFSAVTGTEATDAEIAAATVCKTDTDCDSIVTVVEESSSSVTASQTNSSSAGSTPATSQTVIMTTGAAVGRARSFVQHLIKKGVI